MAESSNHSDAHRSDRDAARARLAKRHAKRNAAEESFPNSNDIEASPDASDPYRPRFKVVGGRDVAPRDSESATSRANGNRGIYFESHSAPSASEEARKAFEKAGSTVGSAASKGIRWAASHSRLVVVVVLILLVAICFAALGKACSDRQNAKKTATERAAYEQQSQLMEGQINLPPSLDPQVEAALKEKAQTNSDVDWIIRHTSALSVDGDTVLKKLLKLTAKEESAISFVRNFPEKYPQETGEPYDRKVKVGTVPSLYQWDERWGYTVYSSTAFGLTGSVPTCMSMVYMSLTGKNDMSPYDMGVLADEMGYMDIFKGTVETFLTEAAPKLGLSAQKMTVSSSALEGALSQGKVVICNVSAGDIADGSHYIVISACDKNGMLTVNDPFSAVNSSQKWDIGSVVSQTKGLWSYSLSN